MFWSSKKKSAPTKPTEPSPLLDPTSRLALDPKETPGYYPGFSVMSQQKFWDATTRDLINDRISNETPIRFFTAEEQLTMQAVVDRILPQDDRTPASRIAILPGIDKRLFSNHLEGYRYEDMPPDQDAYRLAAKAIEAMSKKLYSRSFHELRTIEQEEILQSLHDNQPLAAEKLWSQLNLKRFWTMLVSDCSAVYYAHPSAWNEIGFGGPAYPRGYMRLENGIAESWEVDEQRYEWIAPEDTISDRPQKSPEEEK